MAEVEINGKMVSLDYILDVFVEGSKWLVIVYGEPAVEIDPYIVDEIIDLAPHLVDQEIIDTRKNANSYSFGDWFRED